MEHVGIDLGARYSQICVRQSAGKIVLEKKIRTTELPGWFLTREPSRIIMETCSEAFSLADHARAANHEPVIVPSTLSPQLGIGQRGMKNDVKDGRALSIASCRVEELPRVHIPSSEARAMRELCSARDVLVRSRTKLVNHIRGALRCELILLRGTAATLPMRVREALKEQYPLKLAALEPVLETLEHLNTQLRAYDKRVSQVADGHAVCKQLMSIPGVGPITALRFLASVDDPNRFEKGTKVASYVGLTPGENTTGFKRNPTGITKAGDKQLRRTLIQAAMCLYHRRPNDRIALWARQIEARSSKKKAIVALARKLCVVMHAMWKDGSTYHPHRGGTARETEQDSLRAQLAEALRD